jgi:hypothetical protein
MEYIKKFYAEKNSNCYIPETNSGFENLYGSIRMDDIKRYKSKQYRNKDYNDTTVLNLLNSDYVIFLTDKFFNFRNRYLLKYFCKYNIVYFNYKYKEDILITLEFLNFFIKMSNEYEKDILMIELEKAKVKKLKYVYFLENNMEPDTLYKKISFSKQELFLSFDNYIIKKMEYKLRTFCQIAEKLGAIKIKIKYDSKLTNKTSLNSEISTPIASIGNGPKISNENDSNINLEFEYTNYYYNLNLNKYYISDLIEEESEFFISKEEFKSDIDLKFLIDSRCLNLIQKYDTNIIINRVNELERKIFIKAMKYGINIGYSNTHTDYVSIAISIDFLDIYKNTNCIDGGNLHILKEGFWHLSNIIKEEAKKNDKTPYLKIKKFLETHILYIHKKQIYKTEFLTEFENNIDILKIYYDIIQLNFTKSEIMDLFYDIFKDNMTYAIFKEFRNIILKGSINKIDKIHFISYQYHLFLEQHNKIMSFINTYIDDSFEKVINYIKRNNNENNEMINYKPVYSKSLLRTSSMFDLSNEIETNDIIDTIISEKIKFINIISNCFNILFKTNISKKEDIVEFINSLILKNYYSEFNYLQVMMANINIDSILTMIITETLNDINTTFKKIYYSTYENNQKLGDDINHWRPFDKVCCFIYALIKKNITTEKNICELKLNYCAFKNIISEMFPNNHFICNYDNYKILFTWENYLNIKNKISKNNTIDDINILCV